ncbi:Protein flp [subsurface metagenome]
MVAATHKRVLTPLIFVVFSMMIPCSKGDTLIREPRPLREKLEEIRHQRKLPAIAASVVVGGRVVAASAVGRRKISEKIEVTRDDPFELGSITKPLTGTLVGILKDQGKLDWDTTIGEIFPEMFPNCRSVYEKVTVRQLISHTSGLPYQPTTSQADIDAKGTTVMERRLAYVSAALSDKPEALPGSKYIYSGGGIIVASMAERVTGKSWERLVTENIFQKLDMHTAGFGQMATPPDCVDAPWFHQIRNEKIVPLSPDFSPYPHCRAPVGGVHCSVVDLGRFAALHLSGVRKEQPTVSLIKSKTFKELYSVVRTGKTKGKRYTTGGWRVQPTSWAKGLVYWHTGQSKARGYAVVHIVPEQDYATCVMMNVGGAEAHQAGNDVNLFLVEALRKADYNPRYLFREEN